MSVVVHSRLADMLRERQLTEDDLQRLITMRFGLSVDAQMLEQLLRTDRIQGADLEVAAATAAVLDASLNDLFDVELIPSTGEALPNHGEESDFLTPRQSQRLRELYAIQGQRPLSAQEWSEMDALVATYGRRIFEHTAQDIAAQRGMTTEAVQAELNEQRAQILAWRQRLSSEQVEQLVVEALEKRQPLVSGDTPSAE